MLPILFRLPLPSYNLPYAWIPLFLAAIATLVAVAKVLGENKDRLGAMIAAVLAGLALLARFAFMAGMTETLKIGPLPIYSYGVMLGLSLLVGWYLTLGLAAKDGLPSETMANNYVVTAIAAVVGSRILYIVTNAHEFDTFASMLAMRRGGLVAYGGFLGGLAGSYFFLKRHKLPLLPWADVAVPSLASGLMITRIGCYLFGCDFGRPLKDNAPALLKRLGTFPHWPEGTLDNGSGSPAWAQHVKEHGLPLTSTASLPVHPTQLYESLVGLLLLGLLLWTRRHQKFRGQIFFLFAFAYGVARYLLEMIRDDAERGNIPPALPEHVLIPLGLLVFALGWLVSFSKSIPSAPFRRATQVVAFLPALLVYLALKPETFANATSVQLSTSQFIALTSGFAACVAFTFFYKAALAHPKDAMAIHLPPEFQTDATLQKASPARAKRLKTSAPNDAATKPEATAPETHIVTDPRTTTHDDETSVPEEAKLGDDAAKQRNEPLKAS